MERVVSHGRVLEHTPPGWFFFFFLALPYMTGLRMMDGDGSMMDGDEQTRADHREASAL